jgi:hypothetical protein
MKRIIYDPDEDIETRNQLYVARSLYTNLYTRGVIHWFHANKVWMALPGRTEDEIVAELQAFDKRACPWTDDLQEADTWEKYWIARWQDYMPWVYWQKVSLGVMRND